MERNAWEASTINRGHGSARSQGYRSPDLRTTGVAQDFLLGDRPTHNQGAWEPSMVNRRDSSLRSQGYRSPGTRTTGMTQESHLNERPTQKQSTSNFELESIAKRLLYTPRKYPKDEEKGDQELEKDEHPNQRAKDQESQSPSQAFLPPWVTRSGGREDVTVMVSNTAAENNHENIRFGGRWTHVESEGMSFREFRDRVMQTPGLDDTDLELVSDLVDAIQLHEQEFVHGRYFDPVTRGCVEEGLESKSAVFVSLPAFALEYPRTHTTKRDFEGHPVRALLQSRNCLESTDSRDKAQVITHNSNGDQVVTVPQIWALVINNYTVITCAPIRLPVLLGKTIKIKPHPKASADTGTESLFFSDIRGNAFSFTDLHFTDPQGKVSCVPLALCRTWFGLVKYIVEDCLDDEINPIKGKIKYELLNEGPSFQLVTKEKLPVTMDSWLQIMKKTTTGIIYMSLVDPHEIFKRILVTYHKEETCELDNASDISSIIRHDRGNNSTETPTSSISDGRTSDSHTTVTSIAKTAAEGKSRNLADKLCGLQAKLQEAKAQVDWERVLALSHEIPILEDRILEWTAENLRSELRLRDEKDVFEESEETLPASTGGCRGPPPTFAETSSHISTDICLPESGSSSRSRSRPRSTSPCRRHELLIPAQELSMRASNPPRDTKRPSISYDNRRNISPDRRTRYGTSYSPLRSRGKPRPRERSSVYGFPSHSRAPLEPLASQSRWNTVRSLVLNGQSFSRAPPQPLSPWNEAKPGILNDRTENGRGSQGLSSDSENGRRKRASEKCLARTPNDFSISQALRSYDRDFSQRGDQINEEALNSDISANKSGKLPDAVASSLRLLKTARALPDPLNPADDRAPQLQEDATPRRRNKGVAEGDRDKETRPTLRRLVALAYKAAAMFPGLNMGKNSADASDLFIAKDIEDVPIFLWPTEQILQTLLAEMHNNLRKPQIPGNLSRERASLYEGTVGRSAIEVGKLIPPKDRDNSEATVKQRELVTPLSQRKWKRAEGEDYDQIGTSFGDSRLSAGTPTPELVTEHLRESHALCLQSDVFDLAGKVLHAFVPEGYDAPIVSKYWGAVHKLLRQDMVDVLLFTHLPVTEILASHLSKIHERVQDIQLGMRTNDGSQPSLNQLPKSFIAAFQQLLTLFIVAGNMKELCNSHDSDPNFLPRDQLQTIFEDCNKDLIQCKTEIIQSIRRDDYDGSTGTLAIDSGALLSLILANLTFHSSESEAFNLTRIYRDYTTKLRSLVRNRAYVRVHDHIPPLIEELDIIGSTLKQQSYTLSDYRKLLHIHETPGISFLSRDVLDCLLENIDQRSRNIEELLVEAQSAHSRSRSLKSESNNKAILVFTVTTIIFLPLSFVTSYLGMNTSDLRNMQSGQTLFWEIGAPVAFVVFSTALVAAFYGEVTHRLTRLYWRGKDKFD